MVKVDEAFEVKYKKAGQNFEVLVDFDKLIQYRKEAEKGEIKTEISEVLADEKVFKDQMKGELAPENELEKHFETTNKQDILKKILLEGECQIPTAYKNKLREEKKKQVTNYITENATNPQTKGKYAASLIQQEVDKVRYNYDIYKDYIVQANDVLKELKKVMPIGITKSKIQMRIPGMHCGNFYGKFRNYGKVLKEKFDDNGNLCLEMEVSDSVIDEVTNYISKNSNSEGEYVVMND